jgi:hypothetical protein
MYLTVQRKSDLGSEKTYYLGADLLKTLSGDAYKKSIGIKLRKNLTSMFSHPDNK